MVIFNGDVANYRRVFVPQGPSSQWWRTHRHEHRRQSAVGRSLPNWLHLRSHGTSATWNMAWFNFYVTQWFQWFNLYNSLNIWQKVDVSNWRLIFRELSKSVCLQEMLILCRPEICKARCLVKPPYSQFYVNLNIDSVGKQSCTSWKRVIYRVAANGGAGFRNLPPFLSLRKGWQLGWFPTINHHSSEKIAVTPWKISSW